MRRSGLTLLELVLVLAILVSLASMSVPAFNDLGNNANRDTTRATLRSVQETILNRYVNDMAGRFPAGSSTDPGVIAIARGLPGPNPASVSPTGRVVGPQLHYLYVNPSTQGTMPDAFAHPGWNGPYLLAGRGVYPGVEPLTAVARGFTATYGVPSTATTDGDRAPMDGWGNPLVIMILSNVIDAPGGAQETRAYLVSAGPDHTIDLQVDPTTHLLLRDDDEVLPLITL
jgi:prepilin-type N-terminal cleavage/methylation domain-containing protein